MALPTHSRLTPSLLLFGGLLAWIIALAAVLQVAGETRPAAPEPTEIALQATLGAVTATPLPTATASATPLPSPTPPPTVTPTASSTPSATPTDVPAAPPSDHPAEPTDVPAPPDAAPCSPPLGWERYVVQPDDTLFAFVLGADSVVSVEELMAANCLTSRFLALDQVLFLPPGAAENAPPSVPSIGSSAASGGHGPRPPNCPCMIQVAVGWRREQVADAVQAAQTSFTGADFLAATGPGVSAPFDFVMERPGGTSLEGFLFPGSYTVQSDTTAEQFRDMLLEQFAANVTSQVRADAAAQGVSFYEALTLASIVQRETRAPNLQPPVASIYYNRLRAGIRLRSSVTLMYGLGGPGNWWPRLRAGDVEIASPYNTFVRGGLPPTPINSPGLSAIMAAVYPPETSYFYHSAGCGGGVVFSTTYEEHLASLDCE